ncbi:MAG: winged helix-turn-helix transcriptional regulator [Candidatus Hodarchaeota archaeon]
MFEPGDTTEQIHQIIKDHPGIHFRGIVTESGRQIGVISYHLDLLVQAHRIIAIKHRKHKLFFDSSWIDQLQGIKALVTNLRKKIPRAILLLLSQFPETQELCIKDLAEILKLPPSTLHWHIRRLIQDQIIMSKRRGREVVLQLSLDKEVINHLGEKVYPTRWDQFLDDVDRVFSDLFNLELSD